MIGEPLRVDTSSPVAIKDWVLYQVGIEPEVQA